MTSNQKWALFMVILFFIWGGISYQWYTCGIKGFCDVPQAEVAETPEPEEQQAPTVCQDYLTGQIKLGTANNAEQVRKLEEFLNSFENAGLPVDGVYSTADEAAVKNFQEKYRSSVLDPWGMTAPSGYVYKTTRAKINELYCARAQQ